MVVVALEAVHNVRAPVDDERVASNVHMIQHQILSIRLLWQPMQRLLWGAMSTTVVVVHLEMPQGHKNKVVLDGVKEGRKRKPQSVTPVTNDSAVNLLAA